MSTIAGIRLTEKDKFYIEIIKSKFAEISSDSEAIRLSLRMVGSMLENLEPGINYKKGE